MPEMSECSLRVLVDTLFLSVAALGFCLGHRKPKHCSKEVQLVKHHKANYLAKL